MASPQPKVVMEGPMMKKKSSTPSLLRSISLEWVTRYFILYDDGKLVYYREAGGATGKAEDMIILSENVGACEIDRVKAADLGSKKEHFAVANSFYITVPKSSGGGWGKSDKRILLVTNGPLEFKKWILSFRAMKATMMGGVDTNVEETSPQKKVVDSLTKEVASVDINDTAKEIGTDKITIAANEGSEDAASTIAEATAVTAAAAIEVTSQKNDTEDSNKTGGAPHSQPEDEAEIEVSSLRSGKGRTAKTVEEENLHVSFRTADEVIDIVGNEHIALSKMKSVSFDENIVPATEPAVTTQKDDNKTVMAHQPQPKNEEEIDVSSLRSGERRTAKTMEEENLHVSFRTADEVIDIVGDEHIPLNKLKSVSFDESSMEELIPDNEDEDDLASEEYEKEEAAAGSHVSTNAVEATPAEPRPEEKDPNEGILYPTGCKGAKVFAYGDTLDELTNALSTKAVLYGVVTTCLEDTMDDETYANALPQKHHEEVSLFSLEYQGKNADPNKSEMFEEHLHEIISYCRATTGLEALHPIRCNVGSKVKDDILSVLEVLEEDIEEEMAEETTRTSSTHNLDFGRSSGMTAYKHALATQEPSEIPNGNQVLAIVREQMGIPYNWVLFSPSKSELIVEDAGSGGVVEMTKVLHESYNDRVLFGLARVGFMGEVFGRRPIWFAVEYTGENCTSVKMIRQLRDCTQRMTDLIGDRSFTITNLSASEMTPEAVCERVKRSCDVTDYVLSVDSMNKAHIEEQNSIKQYFEKLEEKEAAKRLARETKRKEEARNERMRSRREKLENAAELREQRMERWSTMSVPEILNELGQETLTGWVLLEIET